MTTTIAPEAVAPPTPRRNFAIGMAVIAVVALGIRVAWVLIARRDFALHGDDFFYHWQANALADGLGFINPLTWKALGRFDPSAAHPPLYTLYLAVVSWFGGTSALTHVEPVEPARAALRPRHRFDDGHYWSNCNCRSQPAAVLTCRPAWRHGLPADHPAARRGDEPLCAQEGFR